MTIRHAEKTDIPRILALIKELAIYEKEPDAVEITPEEFMEAGWSDRPSFTCFVAEVHNQVQGIALCYPRFSTWKGKTIHLEDLVVTQKMRGKGLGKALYDQVLLYAEQQGVRRVEWVVLDWNKNAIDFYEASGAQMVKDWYLVQMDQKALATYTKDIHDRDL